MKQLLGGAVLIVLVGIVGFLYRNTVERPGMAGPEVACTQEARICPDGSSVGRQGPSCDFAACAFPNVEIAGTGIAYAVPAGYAPNPDAYDGDGSLVAGYRKPVGQADQHAIAVRSYPIPEGQDAERVILAHTRYQPADEAASDFSRFETVTVAGTAFRTTVIERFEGMAMSSYFLARENDVLRFDVIEQGVTGWMEPSLDVRQLPEHRALEGLLRTLQAAP